MWALRGYEFEVSPDSIHRLAAALVADADTDRLEGKMSDFARKIVEARAKMAMIETSLDPRYGPLISYLASIRLPDTTASADTKAP